MECKQCQDSKWAGLSVPACILFYFFLFSTKQFSIFQRRQLPTTVPTYVVDVICANEKSSATSSPPPSPFSSSSFSSFSSIVHLAPPTLKTDKWTWKKKDLGAVEKSGSDEKLN